MASKHSGVTELREDVSRFVVHLTRDDRSDFKGGATARKNFLAILKELKILAVRPHCLHHTKIKGTAKEKWFNVACFTEVPLNQIRYLIGPIPGRKIELESYGFVFRKNYLIDRGAQPAIYINSYSWNTHLREAVDAIYESAVAENFKGKTWRILPYVNAMHESYDFTWEREWRIRGDFKFTIKELVCVILPADDNEEKLRDILAIAGIPAIAPDWTYERIVLELAQQQRKTKVVLTEKLAPQKSIEKEPKT